MSGSVPPHNEEAEASVLGAILMPIAKAMGELLTVAGLRTEHFYQPRHVALFAAASALHDRGEAIDPVTVCAELVKADELERAGGESYVHSLPTVASAPGSYLRHAQLLVEDAGFRSQLEASQALAQAALRRDADGCVAAEATLTHGASVDLAPSKQQREEAIWDHFVAGGDDTWRWPFPKLNEMTGGIFRGDFVVVVGWSRHGKSIWLDQILEHAHRQKARCAVYLTEMTAKRRDLRLVARRTGIPYLRLLRAELHEGEHELVQRAIPNLPFDLVPVGGRKWREIGRDIRRQGWDFAAIDLLNVITGRDTGEIDESIGYLADLAHDTAP